MFGPTPISLPNYTCVRIALAVWWCTELETLVSIRNHVFANRVNLWPCLLAVHTEMDTTMILHLCAGSVAHLLETVRLDVTGVAHSKE